MNVEARLAELIGEPAGRLHTARSRNDQVATDVRQWTRDAVDRLDIMLRDLPAALIAQSEHDLEPVMPRYTHLPAAQQAHFRPHTLLYAATLGRQQTRIGSVRDKLRGD